MKSPMRVLVAVDDVTATCPCGATVTGEGEPVRAFYREHKSHTDGTYVKSVTDRAAVWGEQPGGPFPLPD